MSFKLVFLENDTAIKDFKAIFHTRCNPTAEGCVIHLIPMPGVGRELFFLYAIDDLVILTSQYHAFLLAASYQEICRGFVANCVLRAR